VGSLRGAKGPARSLLYLLLHVLPLLITSRVLRCRCDPGTSWSAFSARAISALAVRSPTRACARRSRACPTLEGGLTYRPGLDRPPAQPFRHGHSQAREGERVDPGTLGRRAEPGSRKFGSRGVRANLLAGVTPSEAAIADAAAARGVEGSAAHKAEIEVAALERSLLRFDEVVAAWEQLVAAFRARCLAMPSKLAPRLAVMHERKTIQAALNVEVRAALQELSRFELSGKPPARRAQSRTDRGAPAGSNGKSRGHRRARVIPVH
jgi:hypothetical protein